MTSFASALLPGRDDRRWAPPTLLLLAIGFLCGIGHRARAEDGRAETPGRVDFNKEIRPILSGNCFACHGPDDGKRKAKLRLDSREGALKPGASGAAAIVPGKPDESEAIARVFDEDDESRMPPASTHKSLKASEKETLRRWVAEGAEYREHWAFRRPTRPELPPVKDGAWPRNGIDAFVLARLEREGLSPSPEADRATLIRRLSLDLIGLPPTIAEVDAFLADTSPNAYEIVVDRLLASPHYGERWARRWLDKARYADTNGYEKDRERSIWPYRDWVIDALNADMPFDRFTVEQIAGDLLPNATRSQKVATGFHRNTMINEEGGIDVEEFRFASVVDRVATTGAAWLGLTVQCAQCHTHKFDPITQRDYYRLFALLDNADEPDLDLPTPEMLAHRDEIRSKITALENDLENRYPADEDPSGWQVLRPSAATSEGGATLAILADGSILASGASPETDRYRVVVETSAPDLSAIRLEALPDPSLSGPGRTPHGNFVVSEVRVSASPLAGEAKSVPVELGGASADFSQPGYEVKGAIDGDPATGWAVDDGSKDLNKVRTAQFEVKNRLGFGGGARLTFTLEQSYGGRHTLGRLRLSARRPDLKPSDPAAPLPERRARRLAEAVSRWEARQSPARWTTPIPAKVLSRKNATMTVLEDRSVLASGDKPNNDVYEVELPTDQAGITAVRLEVLPDSSLPGGGPGRAPLFSIGDFVLTEVELEAAPVGDPKAARPVAFAEATQGYASPNHPAALAIDGKPDTGWTVAGGIGKAHAAVFTLREPLGDGGPTRLALRLHQFGIHQMTIGRFRVSVTSDPLPVKASGLPADIEEILLVPAASRTESQARAVRQHYLAIAPEMAGPNGMIEALRRSIPRFPTTMVMRERDPANRRTTFLRRRGEFLQPVEPVEPGVPAALHPLPAGETPNRLALARWLVAPENPLVGRVTVNQAWQAFFGRGIVATVEDFGTRGDGPTHPELLDWLATEFLRLGWSQKAMHRLIVTSATYRQDSRVAPEQLARDPKNELLTRGPRFRVDAEVVRDIALSAAGLLNPKIGGPSVFPPQPEGVTSLAYGQGGWPTSSGPDRYRRGLYTYLKRTAPYAAFITFDAPTSDTTCVRRERSNIPLQALTLLNDAVFVEASRALARRVLAEGPPSLDGRIVLAFRLCTSRAPRPGEAAMLAEFASRQLSRFRDGEVVAAKVSGIDTKNSAGLDPAELAAWTTVARALLNLDETITKE